LPEDISMHESPANQGAGLLGLARPSGPRMMAMVSHGDEKAELPLLWRLCWTLADYGYAVTVLDATSLESDANPGLIHMQENTFWQCGKQLDSPAWAVIPSGRGIQGLCSKPTQGTQNLHRLAHLFPQESVVILYSRAEWVVQLMENSNVEPLLAVSQVKTSLLSSYQALKRLVIHGKLEPTVVNLVQDSGGRAGAYVSASSVNLGDCARNFLGYEVNAINIPTVSREDHSTSAIQRLALRLLESALVLSEDWAPSIHRNMQKHSFGADRLARSH
jgi:hypothetical protein